MEHKTWADRGQQLKLEANGDEDLSGCLAAARLGSIQVAADLFTIWVQLRGSAWVEAKEGKFRLQPGQWIAFEKDSRPQVQADRHGVCIGLSLSSEALRRFSRFLGSGLYVGRGRITRAEALLVLRMWRQAEAGLRQSEVADDLAALRPITLHLAGLQYGLAERIARCPGRSRQRKRQVFGRLQRAHLYLEGNCDRVVRIAELAELTSFSSCYFSRTFLGLFEESPQVVGARLRLDRAARLLQDEAMMVGEVAAASGFDNCCSFARAFRARFGVSATRYRETLQNVRTNSAKSVGRRGKAAMADGT